VAIARERPRRRLANAAAAAGNNRDPAHALLLFISASITGCSALLHSRRLLIPVYRRQHNKRDTYHGPQAFTAPCSS
jgi:hypothetical protein